MLVSIGFLTYLAASLSFAVLGILLVIYRRFSPLGSGLLSACTVTAIWAALVAYGYVATHRPDTLIQVGELLRNGCWLFILLQMLGLQSDGVPWSIRGWRWWRVFLPIFATALTLLALPPRLSTTLLAPELYYQLVLGLWLVLSLLGLLLIEQLFRNATQHARWSIKYLCLGLGVMLAYDFFMYSEALLFHRLDSELWQARGLINALATPLLAVAIARNGNWRINLRVSRQIVFHTVTLMGAGLYLLGVATTGYFIKYLGGSWGSVLQMGFFAAAIVLLLSLLFSGTLRALTRVWLSKHFFSYRYDYREEWLKFTRALAGLNEGVAEGIIRIMAPLASSPAGMLWASDESQPMRPLANWQMPPHQTGEGLGDLPDWLQEKGWVIDLDEWRRTPDIYTDLELPAWLRANEQLWLIIPMFFLDRLQAILILKKSTLKHSINWEDRDLLKTAGRQATTHLAQHMASKALVEARQFEAFNRLSAYVVHDLKNILAQQSLIVSNASKHRNNPAFVADMISTVENSVTRMQRLMDQMRSGVRSTAPTRVFLAELLREVIKTRSAAAPTPRGVFTVSAGAGEPASVEDCAIDADRDRLITVFSHLIQNAQEATTGDGEVVVRLTRQLNEVSIDIEDTGRGMCQGFIRDRLFRPFESTKGLTGMGIGAFESRDYIRQLGGDISVVSTPDKGTTFHLSIPLPGIAPRASPKLRSMDDRGPRNAENTGQETSIIPQQTQTSMAKHYE